MRHFCQGPVVLSSIASQESLLPALSYKPRKHAWGEYAAKRGVDDNVLRRSKRQGKEGEREWEGEPTSICPSS